MGLVISKTLVPSKLEGAPMALPSSFGVFFAIRRCFFECPCFECPWKQEPSGIPVDVMCRLFPVSLT